MFYELETWLPKPGREAECAAMMREWYAYVATHHSELFQEWRSAHYFREVLREADRATGREVMLFAFESREGFARYKERRKDWSGPYVEYKTYDPYPLFVDDSAGVSHWAEQERDLWLDWQPTDAGSFFDVVGWSPQPGKHAAHDDTLRQWFAFVRNHHDRLFAEWRGVRYFRQLEQQAGKPLDRYMVIFEYKHRDGFLAYKERRKDYSGPYADYLKVDPFVYFDPDTRTQEFWQPEELDLWLDW